MIVIVKKIFLFLSSYIPLYILLVGKEIVKRIEVFISTGKSFKIKNIICFNSFGDWTITILALISIILSIILAVLLIRSKNSAKEDYLIVEIENETDRYFFNYFAVYFLPCIGLSIGSITDVFVLVVIMIIIGIVYISNNLIYINPILVFGGFKVYTASVKHISNLKGEACKKIIISNCSNAQDMKGSMVKLSKSSAMYTIHYHNPHQEEDDDE